jgi:hypothetical protein
MNDGSSHSFGLMARGRGQHGLLRRRHQRRLRGGRCVLIAGLVPLAFAVASLFPAAASADLTQGFHVYDLSRYPIKLIKVTGGEFDGTPPIGSVLQPGEGYQDFEEVYKFLASDQGTAVYALVGDNGQTGWAYFNATMAVDDVNQAFSGCTTSYGVCTPGNGLSSGSTLTLYDQPGTVFDIPAGQGQAQAAALKQFCAEDNAATCTFTANSEAKIDSPSHQVGDALSNPTDEDQDTRLSTSDTVETTDSVDVGLKVGAKIAGVVEVSVEAKYGHKWTQEHTFTQDVTVHCPPHHKCWIDAVDPMLRDTGDFTMTLGNTTWQLHDVYFDSPDPNGSGTYIVDDCMLGDPGCANVGLKLGGARPPKVLSGTYTNPRDLDASQITRPTLHLAIAGPRTLTPGEAARYLITLRRSQPAGRFSYALKDLAVTSTVTNRPVGRWELANLAPDKPHTMKLKIVLPSATRGSFCIAAGATAKHANGAHARYCAPVT